MIKELRQAVLAIILVTTGCLLAVSATAQISLPPPGKAWGFNASLRPPNAPAGEDPRKLVLDAAEAAGATHMRLGISWRAYENESSVANPIPASFAYPIGQAIGNNQTIRLDEDYLAVRASVRRVHRLTHEHLCGETAWVIDRPSPVNSIGSPWKAASRRDRWGPKEGDSPVPLRASSPRDVLQQKGPRGDGCPWRGLRARETGAEI